MGHNTAEGGGDATGREAGFRWPRNRKKVYQFSKDGPKNIKELKLKKVYKT